MTGSLWHLVMAAVSFVGSHFLLSTPAVRTPLASALGERLFQALYSVIAIALMVWTVMAFADAPREEVWTPPAGLRHLSMTVMVFACVLLLGGLTTPNPTVAFADSGAIAGRGPVGMLKVTRHPMMWGIGLWGISHLLVRGNGAAMVLFAAMTALALLGALAIDARKRAGLGDAWTAFEAETSFVPLAAVLSRRTRVTLGEIGWWRIALGGALYGVLVFAHRWIAGIPLLPA